MTGLKRNAVKLLPYQKEWAYEAQNTIKLLKSLLKSSVKDVQHIGSTAIPSIHAKPIIDIAAGVQNLEDIYPYIKPLNENGFILRPRDVKGQLLFVTGDLDNDLITSHIHVLEWNKENWNNYINFRDYLNAYTDKALEYDRLKRRLAKRYPNDRASYTKGKQELIEQLLLEAREYGKKRDNFKTRR